MALSRRSFVQAVGLGSASALAGAWIGARGREGGVWSTFEPALEAVAPDTICLSSNENPLGPGNTVIKAVRNAFGEDGRAPGRYSNAAGDLIDALAKTHGVKPDNLVLGCGSTQILRTAAHPKGRMVDHDRPLLLGVGAVRLEDERCFANRPVFSDHDLSILRRVVGRGGPNSFCYRFIDYSLRK